MVERESELQLYLMQNEHSLKAMKLSVEALRKAINVSDLDNIENNLENLKSLYNHLEGNNENIKRIILPINRSMELIK